MLSGLDRVLLQLGLSLFRVLKPGTGIMSSLSVALINASSDSLGFDATVSALWLLCMCSPPWVMYSATYCSVKAVLGDLTAI